MTWKLTWGIHRRTIMSRDVGEPCDLPTLDACRSKVAALRGDFARMGYVLWFATATGPNGERETLASDGNYAR